MKTLQRIQNFLRQMTGRPDKQDTTEWKNAPRMAVVAQAGVSHGGEDSYHLRLAPGKDRWVSTSSFQTLAPRRPPDVGDVVRLKQPLGFMRGDSKSVSLEHTSTRHIKRLPHDQIGYLFAVLVEVRPERAEEWLSWMDEADIPTLEEERLQQLLASSNPHTRELALRLSSRTTPSNADRKVLKSR